MRPARLNRSVVTLIATAVAACVFVAVGTAGSIGNSAVSAPYLDTWSNFTIVDTNNPALAAGRLTAIDYYAGATLPMAFVVVSGSGPTYHVEHVGPTFTPAGTGPQTFTVPAGWNVQAGWQIGMYFQSTGVIPFTGGGDPAAYMAYNSGKPVVDTNITQVGADGRTYSFVGHTVDVTTSCAGAAAAHTGFTQVGATVYVPSTNTTAVAGPAFTDGVKYLVEAAGVYAAGGASQFDILADAEYSQDMTQTGWTKYVNGYEPALGDEAVNSLLDLLVNGARIDWGAFSSDHVYTTQLLGTGTPTTFGFLVDDSYPSNNTGGLCVSVFKDALAPVVSDVAVTPSFVKVGSTVTVTATADDTTKNGSDVASAAFNVNGGTTWYPMTAVDGAFDEPTEAVTASFANVPAGVHQICVKATDNAGNTGTSATCATLSVWDQWAELGGVVVGVSGSTSLSAALNVPTDKGEPDWAFEGTAFGDGIHAWGSVHVNYKSVTDRPVECTFTPGLTGTMTVAGVGLRPRMSLDNWTATCSNGAALTISIQLVPRETTDWGGITLANRVKFPRGGVFLNATPYAAPFTGTYDLYSGAPGYDLWVPLDRGNVHTWHAV